MTKKRVGIVGASGYTGLELCRLLLSHPQVSLTHIFSRQYSGTRLSDAFPHLINHQNLTFETFDVERLPEVDILFLAVPHGQTHDYADKLLSKIKWVIDLSADFRLQNTADFSEFYGLTHANPDLLKKAVYGLPECHRHHIQTASLCANPGCYATCVTLGLTPLAKSGWITGTSIIDAKSGVSGAGRGLKESSLFCEVNEDFTPYSTFKHRHVPEMMAQLNTPLIFSPHLVPMNRGMLASMYVPIADPITQEELDSLYRTHYQDEPFVHIVKAGQTHTKYVAGSNHCLISVQRVPGFALVFSVIDNVMKGASGQAIQNMNLMVGYPETTGLDARAALL
jgi:N-acetyl-gamma-glutamyl-phosphate reductase